MTLERGRIQGQALLGGWVAARQANLFQNGPGPLRHRFGLEARPAGELGQRFGQAGVVGFFEVGKEVVPDLIAQD